MVLALAIEMLMEMGSLVPNSVGLRTRRLLLGVGYRRFFASKMKDQLARRQQDSASVTGSSGQKHGRWPFWVL